jgi:hypothetical protein
MDLMEIFRRRLTAFTFSFCLLCSTSLLAQDGSVRKWERFEQTFTSSVDYKNAPQEATLTAVFTSPSGQSRKVVGFWDGGKTWKIRFSPDAQGKWTYKTACSDVNNSGLNGKGGELTCTASASNSRFTQHGPIRVAQNGRYLTHQDGTPFLFLADTAWNGPLLSSSDDWQTYIKTRTAQEFTAVQWVSTQWRAAPDGDSKKQLAYTGKEKIEINPAFFQRLDEKVEALDNAGLLNVPVMLWAINGGSNPQVNPGVSLPDDQAILLARYMLARWGANNVLWILAGDSDYKGPKSEKWKKIGRAVFGDVPHGPVTMHPGGMQWVWNEFKDEPWYDVVGYQSGHGDDAKTIKWLTDGDVTEDWMKLPHRPFINLEPPYEGHVAYQSKKPITADMTRRALYWSLLVAPTAGVSYGGHGVWGWDNGKNPPTDHPGTGTPQSWDKALKLPGAEQIKPLSEFLHSIDWWRLRPTPMFVVNQPGNEKPERYVAAARTDEKDLMIVYIPEDRTIEIKLNALPPSPNISWVNPRNGKTSPAVAVVTTDTCQFPTPEEGDWILLMTSGVGKENKDKEKAK